MSIDSATPAPSTHARLSPSSSSRWLICPGSALAEMPEVENFYGGREEGTEAHGWAADVLVNNAGLGDVPPVYNAGVALYVEHIESNGHATRLVEQNWQSIAIADFGGTIDCLLLKDKAAVFYDFKYGKNPVKADNNTQLLCYASILAEHFDIEQFWGVIVQPNSKTKSRTIDVAEFAPFLVESHRERVAAAAVSDELVTGQHCLFCPLLQSGRCRKGLDYARHRGWQNYRHLVGVL